MDTELEFDGRLIDVAKAEKHLITELTDGLLTYRVYEMAGENAFVHISQENSKGTILMPLNRRTVRNWYYPNGHYRYTPRMEAMKVAQRRRIKVYRHPVNTSCIELRAKQRKPED